MFQQYAQSALDQYHVSKAKSFLKARAQPDEAIYVTQLAALAQEERRATVDKKVILGVFLFIYLQIDANKESIVGSMSDALGIKPCKHLRLALESCKFTSNQEEHKLSDIANYFRCSISSDELPSEALQAAFLFFNRFELIVNGESRTFFTLEQQLLIYRDNFLCAMLNIKAYARLEKINIAAVSPVYHADQYFQIIENSIRNLEIITNSLLKDYALKDRGVAKKFACLLILESVYFVIKSFGNPALDCIGYFLEKIMGSFFLTGLYFQNKTKEYGEIRKKIFFGIMSLENVLFQGVDEQFQQSLVEWMVLSVIPSSFVILPSISSLIFLTKKEEVLLNHFHHQHALVTSVTIKKASKARAALAAYRSHVKVQIQAETREVYEKQLDAIAYKEESETSTEEEVLGLFLLIILLIQSNEMSSSTLIGSLKHGLPALWSGKFDDEATGSSLERILSGTPCVLPGKTESMALSIIANSCNTPFSPEIHIAYASQIIQKTFLLMKDESISLTARPGTFFTPDQKQLACQYSYLCAMQDFSFLVKLEEITIELFEPDKFIVLAFVGIIKNAMTCLPALADHMAQIFPETNGEEHARLCVKSACFLVLSHIYFETKKAPLLQKMSNSLEALLRRFFSINAAMSTNPMPVAEQLSKVFFSESIINCGLFAGVDESFYAPLLTRTSSPKGSFLEWARANNFLPTVRDHFLIDDFLARSAPLQGLVSPSKSAATVEV